MNMNKQTKFILAIAVQVMVIFIIIIFKLSILAGGNEVFLKIEPVDPRDWLRGDYVTFNYSISNINNYYSKENIKNGDTVYVILHRVSDYWAEGEVTKTKPINNDNIFIKGKVKTASRNTKSSGYSYLNMSIEYGIEEYFIPEGVGQNFNFGNKEAMGKVMIDDNGNAVLKQIYVDDKAWP